jgi:ribonuclease HII
MLTRNYSEDKNIVEVGVDEVGRGPLFGRVYTCAVILPKDSDTFDYSLLKDSKKFSSDKKLKQVYDHIIEHCVDYAVHYESEETIDEINILQATQRAMHTCIETLIQRQNLTTENTCLLIDGNYFHPHTNFDKKAKKINCFKHMCVKGGDNTYCTIAAASIIAKVCRDDYVKQMCEDHPELDTNYGLSSNKGYASKRHREGIMEYGISKWHRKTFGICKEKLVM